MTHWSIFNVFARFLQCTVLSWVETNRVCCQINILIKPFQKPCCCNTQHFEWWWQSHKKSNSKHIQIKLGKIIFCPLLLAHGGKGKYHRICLSRILTLPTQNRQCWKIFQKIFPPKIEIGQLELGDLNNKLAAQRCQIWIFKSININLKREPRVLFCWGCKNYFGFTCVRWCSCWKGFIRQWIISPFQKNKYYKRRQEFMLWWDMSFCQPFKLPLHRISCFNLF